MKSVFQNVSDTNIAYSNVKGSALKDGKLTEEGINKLLNQVRNLYDERRELINDGFAVLLKNSSSPEGRKEMFDAMADLLVFLHGVGHFIDSEIKYTPYDNLYVLPEFFENADGDIARLRPGMPEFYERFSQTLGQHIDFLVSAIKAGDLEGIKHFYKVIDNDIIFLFNKYKKEKFTVELLIERATISNLSKLCSNQQEVNETLKYYRDLGVEVDVKDSLLNQENGTPFLVVYSVKNQIVKNKEYREGKALKNVNWKLPEFGDF